MIIETPRLTLRPYQDEDAAALHDIQNDPNAMRYTVFHRLLCESAKRFRTYAALLETLGFAPWTVILRFEDRIIGWGGLNIDPFDAGWGVEVAYFIDSEHWGKGYATELVRASVAHGFEMLKLPEIRAFAHPRNKASIRVLEKCGFSYVRYEPRLSRNRYSIQRVETHSL